MHQPELSETQEQDEDEDAAAQRRFAELMRRFWRRPKRTEIGKKGQ